MSTRRIRGIARRKPVERRLVCPQCGGAIELKNWRYCCTSPSCLWSFKTLAELRSEKT